jgi:hypothetical protein
MRHWLIVIGIWLGLLSLALPITTTAQSAINATNNMATSKFPDWVTFSVDLKSGAEINRVVLEYGVQQLTCGTVVAKAFPKFTPSRNVAARWTWEMQQSGSEPPGSTLWWRWRVTNADGQELLTDRQTLTWLDDWRPWQTQTGPQVNLYWYGGSKSFAAELQDSAVKSLASLAHSTGLQSDSPIDLYIYANADDLHAAILYEPGWTGGMAFPENNSVIIAISTNQMEWGKRSIAHELTHVLVGRFAFSCLGDTPTWLREGLAMHGEGGPDPASLRLFKAALASDKLLSVRALTGGFAEASDKADLSYSQSYSLVSFLIGRYGQDKVLALLRALRDGTAIDDAMQATYGFDVEGLEDAWRAEVGAKPRAAAGRLSATPTPTLVPTFVPIAGVVVPTSTPTQAPPTVQATAVPVGTGTPVAQATPAPGGSSTLFLALGGVLLGLIVIGLVVVVVVVRRQQRMKP